MMEAFGSTRDGEHAHVWTLRNSHGVEARITDWGATLVSLVVPDRDGRGADVVLGYDDVGAYAAGRAYFGATIGRCANRIRNASFSIDGRRYVLARNEGENSLHGGVRGFDKRLWRTAEGSPPSTASITLAYESPEGEEGYPGTLSVRLRYTLDDDDSLTLDYDAVTDAPTHVNLTNHSYFNLRGTGEGMGDIQAHRLCIAGSGYTPVDATLLPTGIVAPVDGTPFDFRAAKPVGADIARADVQLERAGGYDHNFALDFAVDVPAEERSSGAPAFAAELCEPESGRRMRVFTTEPGLQFYSGNFLDGSEHGKGDRAYGFREGLCLETQHFPDSPNQPSFPSTLLRPGVTYRQTTIYRFDTVAD